MFGYNPAPKPSYGRNKPTAGMRGAIPSKAREKAQKRAQGRCERCGWSVGSYDPTGRKWGLQAAHLIRRHKLTERTTANDIAMLCGPSVNAGTCHHTIDYTAEGRQWAEEYRDYLIARERVEGYLKEREKA